MTKKKPARNSIKDICTPIAVYKVTRNGLRLPTEPTVADALNDLSFTVGRRLSLPQNPNETISEYATRLRHALEPYDRRQSIDGAAVYMLRMILDLYAPPSTAKEHAQK